MEHEGAEESLRYPRPQLNVSNFGQRGLHGIILFNKVHAVFQEVGAIHRIFDQRPKHVGKRERLQNSVEKVRDLKVVNDFAECGVALVQSYNRLLTKDEDELQFIQQVVE